MEVAEETTPSKPPKLVATTSQGTPTPPAAAPASYPGWSQPMHQVAAAAYYEAGTPLHFLATPVAYSNGQTYVLTSQHPMMSPYGNHFPAMYPHGGLYVHPSLTMATPVPHAPVEPPPEEKPKDGKYKKTYVKRRGKATSANNGNSASTSGTEIASHSGTSGSDGSMNGSIDKTNQELATTPTNGMFSQMLADVANEQTNNNGVVGGSTSESCRHPPAANHHHPAATATKLTIGMSLWNGNHPVAAADATPPLPVIQQLLKPPAENGDVKPTTTTTITDQRTQYDREMKKQKRKQSNRESARRSRQRKMADCEDLQKKVDLLYDENRNLAHKLSGLIEECKQLASENNSIKEELTSTYGPEALSNLECDNNLTGDVHSHSGAAGEIQADR